MSSYRRLSTNTSLRDANIFEDIDDEAMEYQEVESRCNNKNPSNSNILLSNIKQEITDSECEVKKKDPFNFSNLLPIIKVEKEYAESLNIYQTRSKSKNAIKIKQEIPDEDSSRDTHEEECMPPRSKKIKSEIFDDASRDSNSNQSLKRNRLSGSDRHSPCHREHLENTDEASSKRIRSEFLDNSTNATSSDNKNVKSTRSAFVRLSPRYNKELFQTTGMPNTSVENSVPTESKREFRPIVYESDPAILARRQKQIAFGKNTIGYDNYIKNVPRRMRTREEPSTPEKYRKYSRRGWDSLIKTWRLKLHNYD